MSDIATLIQVVMEAPAERRSAILRAARVPDRPQPINGKDAAAMLGVCRRTLERYEQRGMIRAIRLSPRLIRFDAREIEALAERGAGA